jgi:hypothetical protein
MIFSLCIKVSLALLGRIFFGLAQIYPLLGLTYPFLLAAVLAFIKYKRIAICTFHGFFRIEQFDRRLRLPQPTERYCQKLCIGNRRI